MKFLCWENGVLHLLLENKTSLEAKFEEAKIREEKLIKSNEEFNKDMKKQTGWWNRWWRCSKNKPNPSCTPLACFCFCCLYLCLCLLLNLCLCFWITALINTYVLLNNSCASKYKLLLNCVFIYRISHRFSHLFFLSLSSYFLLMTKGGVCNTLFSQT